VLIQVRAEGFEPSPPCGDRDLNLLLDLQPLRRVSFRALRPGNWARLVHGVCPGPSRSLEQIPNGLPADGNLRLGSARRRWWGAQVLRIAEELRAESEIAGGGAESDHDAMWLLPAVGGSTNRVLGAQPVRAFLEAKDLPADDRVEILAAMADVRADGLEVPRHLGADIWEVRATGDRVIYRVLFATGGARSQILLVLSAFNKKTQKTAPAEIALAQRRLADWRRRARPS
jgi:phage-related protein